MPIDEQIAEDLAAAKVRGDSEATQALYLRDKLARLPTANFELLKFLTFFFCSLASHSAVNKMTQSNILICIVPTLQCAAGIFIIGMNHFATIYSTTTPVVAQQEKKFAEFDSVAF